MKSGTVESPPIAVRISRESCTVGRYSFGLAVLAVGLVVRGVRPSTVLLGPVVRAYALMMVCMHGGHDRGARHRYRRGAEEPNYGQTSGSNHSKVRRQG